MTRLFRVALLGFSPHERTMLAGYFRMAANRVPRYAQVGRLDDADLMVADADHGPSEQLVLATERLPDTLFIGTRAPDGAAAWLPRPLDPLRVLRELDALVARGRSAHDPPKAAAAPSGRGRTVIQPPRRTRPTTIEAALAGAPDAAPSPTPPAPPRQAPPPAAVDLPEVIELDLHLPEELDALAERSDASRPASAPAPVPSTVPPPAPPSATSPAHDTIANAPATATAPPPPASAPPAASPVALLVDDSEIALRFLQRRLARFGISSHLARDSHTALALLPQLEPDLVFLDMELGEDSALDGLALARRIKTECATRVPPLPVFMVTAHHGQLDRVRATLAGCDALLPKPLADAELERLLARHGVQRAAPD